MKFYQHKTTGELMATFKELLAVVDGKNGNHMGCMTRVVFPEKQIGNGVQFHIIHYIDLKYFKRISRKRFNELCPDFGQYRHFSDNTNDYCGLKRKKTFGLNNPND